MKKRLGKRTGFFLVLTFLWCVQLWVSPVNAFGQQITVSGTVLDEVGDPIPGANVIVKGTTRGVTSDMDGKYTIAVDNGEAVLVFSFIGNEPQEITVGDRTRIDITLKESAVEMEEVVVTALGIRREKKALGYAVQDVKGDEVAKSREMDVINALAGRVAGVNITQGGGDLGGGGSRIVIRGENTITGSNQPLYIIDGVPGGSNDVSADDIENISVLKGPAASALYGSRGMSGVVLITTKSGKGRSGLSVEVNSNTMWQNPLRLPEYQSGYGQGIGGKYQDDTDSSWGNALEPGKAYPNNAKDFYETGHILTNNVSITKTNENNSTRLSYTNVTQKGMVPNTDLKTNRFDLNTSWDLFKNFTVNANVKYTKTTSDNNQNTDPRLWPVSLNLEDLKDYWIIPYQQQKIWKTESDNPYFALYENTNPMERERWFTNLSFNYKFWEHFSVMGRMSYINESYQQEWFVKPGSEGKDDGRERKYGGYSTQMTRGKEMNTDFLLSYENVFFNSDLFMKVSVGGNHLDQSWNNNIWGKTYQLLPGDPIYTLGNFRTYPRVTNNYGPDRIVNSLYAFANFGYKNRLYLDLTARNDWSSTLPAQNNSYFYPSATLSAILSEMVDLPTVMSFWKVRTSYAGVGNDTGQGQLQPDYGYTEGSDGVAGIKEGDTKREFNLKPELASSFEIGTDVRFFNNRLTLDVNYYSTITRNQIWNVQVSQISGYKYAKKNAGKVESHGLEISLGATPVQSNDFTWRSEINWSFDRSKIKELDPANPDLVYTTKINEHMYTSDKLGERRGALYSRYAKKFTYDPAIHSADLAAYDGAILHDPGKKIQRSDDLAILGNYNPDWIGSWYNSFQYKGFNLSFLLSCNYGNTFYANFEKQMYSRGYAPQTGIDRDNKGVLPVNELWQEKANDPSSIHPFRPGDEIDPETYYKEHIGDGENNDYWMRNGSYLKLKEVTFTYTLPKRLIERTFFKDISISLVGRNLAVWSHLKYIDPEIFSNNETTGQKMPGISVPSGVPSARSMGFSVNLRF